MNRIIIFLIYVFFITGCSLNNNSKFWTKDQNIQKENNQIFKEIFVEEEALKKEFNANVKIDLGNFSYDDPSKREYFNNDGRLNYDGQLKKSSRYKFSKIKNFYKFEPVISFQEKNLIFFDNKGSVLKFDEKSKLIWKKNYYSKSEKKLKPILQFANDGNTLIVADNIAKYFALNLNNGNIKWSKNNLAPFNSQIKIYKDKFFIVDLANTLRCFSLKNGNELWSYKLPFIGSSPPVTYQINNEQYIIINATGSYSLKKGYPNLVDFGDTIIAFKLKK